MNKQNLSAISVFIYFLLINFLALFLGSWLSNDGVISEWYTSADKAPWTPPGWVFGAAWTSIMLFYTFYMSRLWLNSKNQQKVLKVYLAQWFFNVAWSPAFFAYQMPLLAQVILLALTFLLFYQALANYKRLKLWSLFIAPYLTWLLVANSLNVYFVFSN